MIWLILDVFISFKQNIDCPHILDEKTAPDNVIYVEKDTPFVSLLI